MKKFKNCISGLYIVLCVPIIFFGCGDPIPINEMTKARCEISRALSIKADKYAAPEMAEAKDLLFESHSFVKNGDLKKAAEYADKSYKMANKAYNKTIPTLASDTIAVAEGSFNEAVEVYAEKLANDEYIEARDTLKKANEQFQNKDYYNAYLTSLEADKIAHNARNIALSKKEILNDSIIEVRLTLENARKYNSEKYSSEYYNLASENLKTANQSYIDMRLKVGFAAIEIAKINADEAYLKAIQGTAREGIISSETAIKDAEKSEGVKVAVDEFAAAKESHESAKSMFKESKYKESIEFSQEAVKLASVVIRTEKPIEITNVETEENKQIEEKKEPPEDEKDYILYRVKYRQKYKDCLWNIAAKYYKNPKLWKIIFNANKNKIKNPDLISPGWILKVPRIKK